MAAMRRSPIPAGLMDIHFVHEAMQEPLVRALPRQARAATRSSRPCRRCRTSCWRTITGRSSALLQPEDRRHGAPALPRRLQPPAEIHHSDDRRPAEGRQGHQRAGAGIGAVVPLLLRHDGFRRGDRAERSELGAHAGDGQGREGRSGAPGSAWPTSMATSASRRCLPRPSAAHLAALWANGARATLTALSCRNQLTVGVSSAA